MTPVKWWAVMGIGFVALNAYLLVAWIASGDATPTPTGADPVPNTLHVLGIVAQAVAVPLAIGVVYWFVVRPLIRERRLSFDGMFVIAMISTYWQDPLVNYMQAWSSYNADLVNLGSWAAHIPGWVSPNGERFVEPLLFSFPGYVFYAFLGVVFGGFVMRKAKARWPRIGTLGLIGVALVALALTDLVVEILWLRSGLYSYGGAIPELTLFHGHRYQFPIYEAVLWGGVWTFWASVRYFRDDRGRSIAERGVERLRIGARMKTAVALLALIGLLNFSYAVYNGLYQWFAVKSGPWVEDVMDRSYLRDQLCGPGTEYACAGPDVPIQKPGAAHVNAEGEFVPADTAHRGE